MNKIKLYIKQAWNLMKQNKLFTGIYVAGTALAIATTMIMAIIYYVKIAPVYPETNRDRTIYIDQTQFSSEKMGTNVFGFSLKALEEWIYPLEDVEAVSATYRSWHSMQYVQPVGKNSLFQAKTKLTDTGFFRIYPFRFVEGKPFTESDMQSELPVAVITDELARRVFGKDTGITGETINIGFRDYRITGVVESASTLTARTYAQAYFPYTTHPNYKNASDYRIPYYGAYSVTILLKSGNDVASVRKQITEAIHKYNHSQEDWEMTIFNQPHSHVQSVFHADPGAEFSWGSVIRHYLLILTVLLLVPALNLCGMIAGRMDVRLSEMAVRKSFGASKATLLHQVISENLLMTFIGGLIGMVMAWIALMSFREWIFALFDFPDLTETTVIPEVTGEMLFAPGVFLIALTLCIILNLLSALVPAWLSLRKPIIQSMNEKR